jgi:hypothetical protein
MDARDDKITGTTTLTDRTDDPPPAYSQQSNAGKTAVMPKEESLTPSNPLQRMYENRSWGSGDDRVEKAAKLFIDERMNGSVTGSKMSYADAMSHLRKLQIENLSKCIDQS